MKHATLLATLIAIALFAPTSANAAPPPGAICPVGYNGDAILNMCVVEPETDFETREACLIGDVCLDIPVVFYSDGQPPAIVYFDAACNLTDTNCGCSHLADGLVYSCTTFQTTQEPSEANPDEPGRDDNTLLVQEGDNCLPTTYEHEAFANLCIVLGPEWGSGINGAADELCVFGDVCVPQLVGLTDGDGLALPAAAYMDVLCNQPFGCGCGFYAQRLLLLCSPLQS